MLKNYFKIAIRGLYKHKLFSLINILGLAIGMAACMLILRYVQFELSYDDFHEKAEHIYRVSYHAQTQDSKYESALNFAALGSAVQETFPEIIDFTRLYPFGSYQFSCALQYEEMIYNESNVSFADANFLTLFTFPLIEGTANTALQQAYTAVISEKIARKYFGKSNPIGKTLSLKSSSMQGDFQVTGIMKDIPQNTHFAVDVLLSMRSLPNEVNTEGWDSNIVYTYLQLDANADPEVVTAKLPDFLSNHIKNQEADISMNLQPLQDIYLHSKLDEEMKPGGSLETITLFAAVALIILLIAWINYINLTTARALERAKEVGIRKVSGAMRIQLVSQFLIESVLINGISIILAFTYYQITSHLFFPLFGIHMSNHFGQTILTFKFWLPLMLFFFAGICVSGLYPAYLLSSFQAVKVLKGKLGSTSHGINLRKSMVVIQFMISIGLIVGVLTLDRQYKFMQVQELGIDIGQTLVLKTPSNTDSTYFNHFVDFKENLKKYSWVDGISTSAEVPGKTINWTFDVQSNQSQSPIRLPVQVISTEFIDIYGLKLIAGRNFLLTEQPETRFGNKTESVILNEEAVKQLGYESPEHAIGSTIYANGNICKIVGVINNFHQSSLKDPLQAFIFLVNNKDSVYYSIKLAKSQNQEHHLASIQAEWNTYFPDNPFDYFYLENHYQQQYQSDRKLGQIFTGFSILAVLISCLGLFGLSSYTMMQRTKEIGIRKVLGASVKSIVHLLTLDFVKLILLASLIAIPISYWGIKFWLQNYAYRIEISIWLLLIPFILVMLFALLTVSAQTIKAALANPVKSLRYE